MSIDIPIFVESQVVDNNGYLTPIWRNIFISLFEQLQSNFSDEGLVVPSLPTDSIAQLTGSDPFTLIGDSTLNLLKVNIAGTFKTVTTS